MEFSWRVVFSFVPSEQERNIKTVAKAIIAPRRTFFIY